MSGEMEDDDEPMLYLIFHGGYARVVGEDDNWSVAYEMAGDTGRLFAAAPELLAACQAAIGAIQYLLANDDNGPAENCIELLAGAINKAEGRAE